MASEVALGEPAGVGPPLAAASRPSLRRFSAFSVTWWVSVVGGLGVAAYAAVRTAEELAFAPFTFWVLAALVVVGELRPILTAGGYDPQGIPLSDAFVFATLYIYGPWPAICVLALGTLSSEIAKRKVPWKIPFNVGQYVLSLCSAALFMTFTEVPSLADPMTGLSASDMLWIIPGWLTYFFVNLTLVAGLYQTGSGTFAEDFFDDFGYYFVGTGTVLVLSPLVVLVAQVPVFLPLLLPPLFAVHRTATISMEKEHQSLHDSLTGLPNRNLLMQRLDEAVAEARRSDVAVALCLLDLDRFKEVNDTLGHHVGDRLLALVAERLNGALRPTDLVSRLGGDEFGLLLTPVSGEVEAREVAERTRAVLARPFHLEGMLFELEASIGIALYPEHGTEAEPMMRRADVAMYLAKEERTGIEVYHADRDQNSASRLTLLGGLRSALENGEIQVHYQPKVSLGHGGIAGVEALVRWHHPTRGLIMPDEFIPIAEHTGLMGSLTAYVVDHALAQVASWRDAGIEVPVAVNVSSRDLHGTELIGVVGAALEQHGVPAWMLTLELTERVLTRESTEVSTTLTELRSLGVSISLDDFGTGYSSMLLLKQMPVSEVKVDRSFVSRLSMDAEDVTIVRSIIDLAHGLGMQAVAEGVETREVWDLLDELGCDSAQGWYVSRPMAGPAASEWLLRHPSQRPVLKLLRGRAGAG